MTGVRVSRRGFLKTAAVPTTGIAAFSGTASADHLEAKPAHVTLEFDREFLEAYRPTLVTAHLDVQPFAIYGMKASSPDRDTTVAVYACGYAVQSDVWQLTSHAGDHEWFYVFVNRDGTVDQVVYAAYHWQKGALLDPSEDGPYIYTDSDGYHPKFQVAKTYHHYYPTEIAGRFVDVEPLMSTPPGTGEFSNWLDNGMEDDLRRGAVVNPWLMTHPGGYEDWWSREGISYANVLITSAWRTVGIRGWDSADGGDISL